MHSKNNRNNKDFQIVYFLIGSCHTPDGAYSLLKDLQEDREMALAQLEGAELRKQAKMLRIEKDLQSDDPVVVLEARADLADMKNNEVFEKRNIEAAKAELDFIKLCIERIQPLRKFANLPDSEAHEAAQFDEWKYELIHRAENYLITSGSIPPDQLSTMRQHPAFNEEILPAIEHVKQKLINGEQIDLLTAKRTAKQLEVDKLLMDYSNTQPQISKT